MFLHCMNLTQMFDIEQVDQLLSLIKRYNGNNRVAISYKYQGVERPNLLLVFPGGRGSNVE